MCIFWEQTTCAFVNGMAVSRDLSSADLAKRNRVQRALEAPDAPRTHIAICVQGNTPCSLACSVVSIFTPSCRARRRARQSSPSTATGATTPSSSASERTQRSLRSQPSPAALAAGNAVGLLAGAAAGLAILLAAAVVALARIGREPATTSTKNQLAPRGETT